MRIKYQLRINIIVLQLIAAVFISSVVYAQDCKSSVEVITNNSTSRIYIDTVFVGSGKIKIDLTMGNHSLLIKNSSLKWGQKNINDTLRILECDKVYNFNYDMKQNEYSYVLPEIYEYMNKNNNENFFTSSTFKILIGTAAVLGGVAAYFKIKADKKYEDCLMTKNRSTLDEVDRFDLYSGVAFGLLQINFGYLIYKFLTD